MSVKAVADRRALRRHCDGGAGDAQEGRAEPARQPNRLERGWTCSHQIKGEPHCRIVVLSGHGSQHSSKRALILAEAAAAQAVVLERAAQGGYRQPHQRIKLGYCGRSSIATDQQLNIRRKAVSRLGALTPGAQGEQGGEFECGQFAELSSLRSRLRFRIGHVFGGVDHHAVFRSARMEKRGFGRWVAEVAGRSMMLAPDITETHVY